MKRILFVAATCFAIVACGGKQKSENVTHEEHISENIAAQEHIEQISENIAAQEHIQQRETAVIEQQKAIKEIVKLYREVNGRYPGSMEEGNAKYHIGDDKNGNRIDIEYFGVTVGSLEKVSLDGSWEDQRSKQ